MSEDKEIKCLLEEQSSEILASRVIVYRVLKYGKEDSIKAMQILEQRKKNGDNFDYISFIDNHVKELPKPTIGEDKIFNIKSILKNVKQGTF